jgi:RND family efflux transporter MFP subunit
MRAQNHWTIALGAVLALTTLSGSGCRRGEGEDGAAAVADVTTVKVARAELSRLVTVSGTIAALPDRDVKVSALVPGRIAELKVAEGDAVVRGGLLARIDPAPYQEALASAEAAAGQARAQLENARLSRARTEALFAKGIAARKEVEDAAMAERVGEAAVKQTEAALALARTALVRTELRSPLDGTVVKRFTSAGEQVDGTAAQPVVEVANLKLVELLAGVPAAYLPALEVGETLALAGASFPQGKLEGRIVTVSEAVDPLSNAGLVRVRFDNARGVLRLGEFATVEIPVETHRGVLAVPKGAVYVDQDGGRRVYRVDGDTATATAVEVGLESSELVELASGVKEGDTLVLDGGYGLPDSAKVCVKGAGQP